MEQNVFVTVNARSYEVNADVAHNKQSIASATVECDSLKSHSSFLESILSEWSSTSPTKINKIESEVVHFSPPVKFNKKRCKKTYCRKFNSEGAEKIAKDLLKHSSGTSSIYNKTVGESMRRKLWLKSTDPADANNLIGTFSSLASITLPEEFNEFDTDSESGDSANCYHTDNTEQLLLMEDDDLFANYQTQQYNSKGEVKREKSVATISAAAAAVNCAQRLLFNDKICPESNSTKIQTEAATCTVSSSKPASNEYKPSSNGLGSSNANLSLNSSVISSRVISFIASLTPYQNKWVIKARVTSKTNVREWKNAKGEGKLFSMDLMDESGEIRATCFKDACDKYFHMIQMNKVYYISKCQVKLANKRFTTTIDNDYEMTFKSDTVVEECADDHVDVPKFSYNLVPLSQISQMKANATVDVAGVCREIGDIFQFTAKTTGRELKKRDVTLVDRSRSNVSLTLWGQDAENFDGTGNPIVFVKNGRINEFNGKKSISLNSGSTIKLNPEISDLSELRQWRDNGCPGELLERLREALASAEMERLLWESSQNKEGVTLRVNNIEMTYGCRIIHSELDGKHIQFIIHNSNVIPEIGDLLCVKFDEEQRCEVEGLVMYSFVDKVIKLND